MTFEEWWDKEEDKHVKEYVLMGPFALRNIAKVAWDKAVEVTIENEKTWPCEECGETYGHDVGCSKNTRVVTPWNQRHWLYGIMRAVGGPR